jgi:hypothetical protein
MSNVSNPYSRGASSDDKSGSRDDLYDRSLDSFDIPEGQQL